MNKNLAISYEINLRRALSPVLGIKKAINSELPGKVSAIDDGISFWENESWWSSVFSRFQNLEFLQVAGPYTYIPKTIFFLRKLKLLEFSTGYVDSLPPEILNLQLLEYLDLSGNYFEEWPDFLYSCESIRYLNLSDNEAHVDLEKVASMPNLLFLHVYPQQVNKKQLNVFREVRSDVDVYCL